MKIDWEQIGRKIGAVHEFGESGGEQVGREALSEILGVECIEEAVETYVSGSPGSTVARSVLSIIRPDHAVAKCIAIFESGCLDRRRAAVELLRSFASRSLLTWTRVFIGDPDGGIASWGLSIAEQLVLSGEILPEEVDHLILVGESHLDAHVREAAARVREAIAIARRPPH